MRHILVAAFGVVLAVGSAVAAVAPTKDIAAAVAAKTRAPENVARDRYRHPAQTLAFFGVKPTDTLVEIWPGGGWYTEILAPLTNGRGTYYAAAASEKGLAPIRAMQVKDPKTYGAVKLATVAVDAAGASPTSVPDGVADTVLTFRNVHNWRFGEKDQSQAMFDAMFRMLKKGGTLGVVEHRLPEARPAAQEAKSGYMKTSSVIGYAEKAGFRLVARSEINANKKDKASYPDGVWTLPPTYTLKDKDRAKYAAIGESDRMTLKFVKP